MVQIENLPPHPSGEHFVSYLVPCGDGEWRTRITKCFCNSPLVDSIVTTTHSIDKAIFLEAMQAKDGRSGELQ